MRRTRYWFTWTCDLGPAALEDLSAVLKQARDLVAQKSRESELTSIRLEFCCIARETTRRRQKRLSEAVAAPEKNVSSNSSAIYPQFFLAMTKQKLGYDKAEAKRLLAEAADRDGHGNRDRPLWDRRGNAGIISP